MQIFGLNETEFIRKLYSPKSIIAEILLAIWFSLEMESRYEFLDGPKIVSKVVGAV